MTDEVVEEIEEVVGEPKDEVEEAVEEIEENVDDDIEGDSEEESSEEDTEEPEKPVSRAQNRIQKLSSDLKTERNEREKLVAERATAQAELKALQQQQRDNATQVDRRAEEERLALLAPEEREVYQAKQRADYLDRRLQQLEMQQQDSLDRAEFHAKAAHDETYSKYADRVETMYQEGLQRGVVAPREDLHSLVLGQELKKNAKTNTPAKKAAAKKRVDAVTSRPASAKSNVSGSRRGKTAEERLQGVEI
ncbi:hypothetical protein KAR91_17980 [Candidatus Pacearchaeota archaeon]|nr:hypothetical protein [Candidatus Pacearchaeota archaeon]